RYWRDWSSDVCSSDLLQTPRSVGRPLLITPQDGADAGHQLARVEGLGKIIVGAEFQADDAVDILAARREHDHGHFAFAAQLTEYLEAIHAGEHDVEHHQ